MRPRTIALILAVALTAGAAPAAGATRNQRSTKRFIAASLSYFDSVVASEASSRAATDALVARVAATCPRALGAITNNSPQAQQDTATALAGLAEGEVVTAEFAPDAAAGALFAGRIKALRWSSRTLTRKVVGSGDSALLAIALMPPDLCRETATATATGLTTIPPDTARFLDDAGRAFAQGMRASDLLKLMKPYVTPGEAASAARLRRRQITVDRFFSKLTADGWSRTLEALFGPSAPTLV